MIPLLGWRKNSRLKGMATEKIQNNNHDECAANSSSASLPRLPTEVLELILSYLDENDFHSLLSLCVCCNTLYNRVLSHVYKSVTLDSGTSLDLFKRTISGNRNLALEVENIVFNNVRATESTNGFGVSVGNLMQNPSGSASIINQSASVSGLMWMLTMWKIVAKLNNLNHLALLDISPRFDVKEAAHLVKDISAKPSRHKGTNGSSRRNSHSKDQQQQQHEMMIAPYPKNGFHSITRLTFSSEEGWDVPFRMRILNSFPALRELQLSKMLLDGSTVEPLRPVKPSPFSLYSALSSAWSNSAVDSYAVNGNSPILQSQSSSQQQMTDTSTGPKITSIIIDQCAIESDFNFKDFAASLTHITSLRLYCRRPQDLSLTSVFKQLEYLEVDLEYVPARSNRTSTAVSYSESNSLANSGTSTPTAAASSLDATFSITPMTQLSIHPRQISYTPLNATQRVSHTFNSRANYCHICPRFSDIQKSLSSLKHLRIFNMVEICSGFFDINNYNSLEKIDLFFVDNPINNRSSSNFSPTLPTNWLNWNLIVGNFKNKCDVNIYRNSKFWRFSHHLDDGGRSSSCE